MEELPCKNEENRREKKQEITEKKWYQRSAKRHLTWNKERQNEKNWNTKHYSHWWLAAGHEIMNKKRNALPPLKERRRRRGEEEVAAEQTTTEKEY